VTPRGYYRIPRGVTTADPLTASPQKKRHGVSGGGSRTAASVCFFALAPVSESLRRLSDTRARCLPCRMNETIPVVATSLLLRSCTPWKNCATLAKRCNPRKNGAQQCSLSDAACCLALSSSALCHCRLLREEEDHGARTFQNVLAPNKSVLSPCVSPQKVQREAAPHGKCKVCTAHCALQKVQCTVCTAHCALQKVQCTVCVHCTHTV